jgi:anti-sigma B factor antagonist
VALDERYRRQAEPAMMRVEDYASFRVEADEAEGRVELRLVGELDLGTAGRVRSAFAETPASATVVVDLAELDFIDSSGLHELVVALKRQRAGGGDIILRNPSGPTLRVLEIVGLTKLFAIT